MTAHAAPRSPRRPFTPEEESVGDPDDEDAAADPLTPGDLWFRHQAPRPDRLHSEPGRLARPAARP